MVVVVAHDTMGAALRMTLLSALRMSPPPAAVVVAVTTSSTSSAATTGNQMPAALAAALTPAELLRVRWMTVPGATLAGARNAAVAAAGSTGSVGSGPILVADAGTFLEPHAGATLTAALSTAAADVVTSLVHFYGPGDSMPAGPLSNTSSLLGSTLALLCRMSWVGLQCQNGHLMLS